MPKPSSSRRLEKAAIDLAWGLWIEAGVSGTGEPRSIFAIDPEALVILTACLGDADPRLRDEATDWCIRYGRFVSVARLRNLLKTLDQSFYPAFGEFAATVNEHARSRWPYATRARTYRPTGRSRIEDFTRPALIALRTRAVFGVGTRAEVLRVLLAGHYVEATAADLAADVSYTKRNVAEELEALRMGGLLDVAAVGNQNRYRLTRAREMTELLGTLPILSPRWPELVRVLLGALQLAERLPKMNERARLVEVDSFLRSRSSDMRRSGLAPPRPSGPQDLVAEYERWIAHTFERIAAGDLPEYASRLPS